MPTSGDTEPAEVPAAQRYAWLATVLACGAALRAHRLAWGLPGFIFADTKVYFVEPAMRAAAEGDWALRWFTHPPPFPYFVSLGTFLWAHITGREIALTGIQARADMAAIAIGGRAAITLLSLALIVVVYLLCKRLLGTRTALWAAAFFALSPLHVIESHRINVDTPMLLLAMLSAHQAVVAYQKTRTTNLWWAFALAATAGATKYTGLFAGTLPIWVVLRWPATTWSRRIRMLTTGAVISLFCFALLMSPALLNGDTFVRNVVDLFYIGIFQGAPGQNLVGESWVYAPYLYLVFVGLPFMLGWPVALASALGIPALALHRRQALTLITAAALPFFLLQGAAETATTRYYFPLAPYLAMTAAALIEWIRHRSNVVGIVLGGLIIAYTATLTWSQVNRIGGAPQAAIGAALRTLSTAKRETGISLRAINEPKLIVAYPSSVTLQYDAIDPYVRRGRYRKLIFFPSELRWPGEAVAPGEALREDRRWVVSNGLDVVVVPSRWENLRRRASFRGREEQFYQNLTTGRLGLRQAAHEETTYFTQSWYEWADPTLDTLWTAGIAGYKLYVRDDLLSALAKRAHR